MEATVADGTFYCQKLENLQRLRDLLNAARDMAFRLERLETIQPDAELEFIQGVGSTLSDMHNDVEFQIDAVRPMVLAAIRANSQ